MPDWRAHVQAALAGFPGDPQHADEIAAELGHHLEDRYRQSLAEGATDEEARSRALDELTDAPAFIDELTRVERSRTTGLVPQESGGRMMSGIWQDWRYGFRMLRRDPWFTVVVAITLALGIGANGAIFSVVHAVLLRELPYSQPDELVMVWESRPREGVYDNVVSPADFLDWRTRQAVFDDIAAQQAMRLTLLGPAGPERVGAGNISTSFFKVLGVVPALGRDFSSKEERAGRNQVVILNHGFWQRRFGADPDIVGRSITLEGQPYEVIGVLPASFRFSDESIELWYPIDFTVEAMRARFNHFLTVFARLKEGVSIDRAQQNMDLISGQLQREVELQNQGHGAHVIQLRDQLVGDVRPSLLVLMAAVASILLIACVNVANLLLARGASREKEVAVRSSLGAGRGRIVRQLVVECISLAGLAAIAAVPLTMWGASALRSFVPMEIPRLNDAGLNPVVLGFMVVVALVTAVLFSLAPALQVSKLNLTDALKEGGAMAGISRRRLRKALVVAEIALAFVLLVGAGLMTRTLVNLLNVDTGFESENVLTIPIALSGTENATPDRQAIFFRELLAAIEAQPGVDSVGFTSHLPMGGRDSRMGLGLEGREPDPKEPVRAHWRVVTPGYFAAMQIRLASGRLPTQSDMEDGSPPAVINRTAAERYWPGVDPIGKRLRVLTPEWREIIGVIEDVRHWGPSSPVNPEVYLPGFQTPTNLVVRGAQGSSALMSAVREQVRTLSPELALANIRTMDDIRGRQLASPRFYLILLGIFACGGVVLAVLGVYGVMSYTVVQSRADIGIRMAIGARGGDVVRMFVDEGLVLTGVGLMLGAIGAFLLTRLMTRLLFGVTPTDAPTFVAMALLMGVVALVACYVPARRAANVDPLMALRRE
jgi:putative ABC transport system permease protein